MLSVTPLLYIPYNPVNYNELRTHYYGGYSDNPNENDLTISNEMNRTNSLLPSSMNNSFQDPTILTTTSSSLSSKQHFDRVLMPVSIHQTLSITDMQAGALLGPKGERIQQLQRETGAIVNIGDVHEDNGEKRKRIVNIQGSQQQVNNALQVIKKILMIIDDDVGAVENSCKKTAEKIKKR